MIVLEESRFLYMKQDLSFEQYLEGYKVDLDGLALKVLKRNKVGLLESFKGLFRAGAVVSCDGFLEVKKSPGEVRVTHFWIDCKGVESELELGAIYREFDLLLRSYHWKRLNY